MKKSFRWRVIYCLLALSFVFGLARIYYRVTDDFRLGNITHEMPHQKKWDIPQLTFQEKESLNPILDQTYSYLGKGAQSYAFLSEDGNYVLKFFKFKHLRSPFYVKWLPAIPPFKRIKEKDRVNKLRKLFGVFDGYKLAYDVNKEDSGLVFIHLNPTPNIHKTLVVKDKIGLKRKIDLDSVIFVIQKRAKTTRMVVKDCLERGDLELCKYRIGQIYNLFLTEYAKGIYDRDHGVMHNTGFIGEKPIHLDVGKIERDEHMKQLIHSKKDLEKIDWRIETWIRKNYPQYFKEIDRDMEEKFVAIYGEKANFKPVK